MMLELTSALVLTFACLVTANPYGYGGVKGGAIAKADSAAVAGALSSPVVLPLVPSGGGSYSGSFSKSSASSFASSSSSSSASSFSFSGSGNAGHGHDGLVIPGISECSNGNCQNGETKCGTSGNCQGGSIAPTGDGSTGFGQSYNGAGSVASSISGAIAGSGIGHDSGASCAGGICDSNKPVACTGPDCNQPPKTEFGSSSYDTEDIAVNTKVHGLRKPSVPSTENVFGKVSETKGSACTSAICASSSPVEHPHSGYQPPLQFPQPSSSPHPKPNSPQNYQPYTPDYAAASGSASGTSGIAFNKPATFLSVPKDTKCTGLNCGTNDHSNPAKLPTDFKGSYPSESPKPYISSCKYGNCEGAESDVNNSGSSSSDSVTSNYINTNYNSDIQPGKDIEVKCTTPNCGTAPEPVKGPSFSYVSPTYITPNGPIGSNDCVSGNCGSNPGKQSQGELQIKSTPKIPSYSQGSSSYDAPLNTVGTPGCTGGNCGATLYSPIGTNKVSDSEPTKSAIYSTPSQFYPASPNGCTGGICGQYPNPSLPTGSNKVPAYQSSSQSYHTPTSHTGCTGGNCGSYPSPPVHIGITGPSKIPYYQSPSPTFQQPTSSTGCTGGQCGTNPFPTLEKEKCTGNCGVPAKPLIPSYPSPSPTYNGLSGNAGPLGCTGGNCGFDRPSSENIEKCTTPGCRPTGTPQSSSFQQIQSPQYSTINTDGQSHHSCIGGNCPTAPTNIPTGSQTLSHSGPASFGPGNPSYSPACQSGNCGSYLTAPPKPNFSQEPSPVFQPPKPTGISSCTTPNCAGTPQTSGSENVYPSEGTYIALNKKPDCTSGNCPGKPLSPFAGSPTFTHVSAPIAPVNQKAPAYNGGFGGPPGLLKPNDFSAPKQPFVPVNPTIKPYNHASPSTTIQASVPSPTVSYQPLSQPGHSLPHYSQSGSQSSASALAGATAVAYSGGFGGPPGLLKPYDNGLAGGVEQSGSVAKHPESTYSGGILGGSGGHSDFTSEQSGSTFNSGSATGSGYHSGFGDHGSSQSPSQYSSGSAPNSIGATAPTYGSALHGGGSESKADVVAGSTAGAIGGASTFGHRGSHDTEHLNGASGGCNGGCSSHGGNSYGGGSYGAGGSLGFAKSALFDKLANGADAAGKSLAGATSSAGTGTGGFGLSGSFASSASSAHAFSGSATKGGYGRR